VVRGTADYVPQEHPLRPIREILNTALREMEASRCPVSIARRSGRSKGFHTKGFVAGCREINVTAHVAQNSWRYTTKTSQGLRAPQRNRRSPSPSGCPSLPTASPRPVTSYIRRKVQQTARAVHAPRRGSAARLRARRPRAARASRCAGALRTPGTPPENARGAARRKWRSGNATL
jgi:hypothetical protein